MNNKLYTWIDVQIWLEEYFNQEEHQTWLENINFRSYWDGLTISYAKPKSREEIEEKLDEIFGGRFKKEQNYISLEGAIQFPIFFEEVEKDEIDTLTIKPTLGLNPFIATKNKINTPEKLKTQFFAFHSFKGGVGRTLHAIAFALHLTERKNKVLLIDADFEAPGISWLLKQSSISFADFLAMIHGSKDHKSIIEITAKNLRDTDEENGHLFILPAFRGLNEGKLPSLEIKPEHIYKFSSEPFFLTDILDALAQELKVDYVILDLRAGFSELSSGWFFDPRIQKVFVTTLSSQSLLGTAKMFDIVSQFDKENHILDENLPFLIISQVPTSTLPTEKNNWESPIETIGNPNLLNLRKKYIDAFSNFEREDFKGLSKESIHEEIITNEIPPYTLFSEEKDSLKALPDTWQEVSKRVRDTYLHQEMSKLSAIVGSSVSNQGENFDESRKKLKEAAHTLIFAEKNEQTDFLVTKAIENLVTHFRSKLPIAVIVGAKGSGKTFLYKQIWQNQNWKTFIATSFATNSNEAYIIPITIPQNGFNELPRLSENIKTITNYQGKDNIWEEYVKPSIEQNLKNDFTDSEWRKKWLDYMAWSVGFEVNKENVGNDFIEFLKEKKQKVVAIFDGLEDLFTHFNTDIQAKKAIKALLQDVPNWLERQGDSYLGVVAFVRKDIVSAAITQNSGQFLNKYAEYELKWDAEEALRLIHWILIHFEIFKSHLFKKEELKDKNFDDLFPPLYKLWGMRMASNTSKEAYSHNWVLGALANLKKEVQSRDIVRFLEFATEESMNVSDKKITSLYIDRLFYPSAIRDSIKKVGSEKIEEVEKENQALKAVLEILKKKTKVIKFPCSSEQIKEVLPNEDNINVLVENGVLILHKGEYYMASIYQQSMGFEYSRKGKPKVLYF